jgi:hypothetical protein
MFKGNANDGSSHKDQRCRDRTIFRMLMEGKTREEIYQLFKNDDPNPNYRVTSRAHLRLIIHKIIKLIKTG